MYSQITKQFHRENPKERAAQGDILKDFIIISYDGNDDEGYATFIKTTLKYALIISQDCDLENDYNSRKKEGSDCDKFLSNLLILPVYLPEEFKIGTHRGDDYKGMIWGKDLMKDITGNKNPRFHFIEDDESLQIPPLVIDFKQIFTIKRELLYKNLNALYIATICELYRENLSQRYSHYLSRIGLPDKSST